jgi:hypothetical protein
MEFTTPFERQLACSASVYHWIKTKQKLSSSQTLDIVDNSEIIKLSSNTILANVFNMGIVTIPFLKRHPKIVKEYLEARGYKLEATVLGWKITTPSGKGYHIQARELNCPCANYTIYKCCNHIMMIKLAITTRHP